MGSEPAETARAAAPCTAYLEHAGLLGSELVRAGAAIARGRELPEPVVEALARRGLFHRLLPRGLRGVELPPAAYVPVMEEIAIFDASAAWCLSPACGCTVQAQTVQSEARISAVPAFLSRSLGDIWQQASQTGRLGPDNAEAAAILEENPFERRFRDIHTETQQYQGRQSLFETVRRALFGLGPESAMSTF